MGRRFVVGIAARLGHCCGNADKISPPAPELHQAVAATGRSA
jgi:hypothetical protein